MALRGASDLDAGFDDHEDDAAPTTDPVTDRSADPTAELAPRAAAELSPGGGLNPAQRDVLTVLGARPHERPEFDPRLRHELRADLEERLAPSAALVPDDKVLWLSKHALSSVHGCESHYLAREAEDFAWSPTTARGTVAHKALELCVHWRGEPVPGDLVDEAFARLIASTNSVSPYLGGMTEGERADLRSGAVERVAMFLECFPPLESRWRPVTESRLRADLCQDKVVLGGKVDLTVGRPDGLRAGKVLLDLKTGGFAPAHRDDLRFYALIETLRIGTPPRLLATYYLDGGRLQHETVTEDVLQTAVERVVQGARAVVELRHEERTPVLRPGPPCRWCPLQSTCVDGQRWLEERAELEGW
ncbi:MAG: PD-(D/E)XK nuclease family protein [Acidimicrobiales bacterium]|nr:PD-(D/E)XK nuclease family protein [Acidimicrobiales bacterium]